MSSNGIGLQTPRGTGTNGYVQKNVGAINNGYKQDPSSGQFDKRQMRRKIDENDYMRIGSFERQKQRSSTSEHDRKRLIEVKCMELRESLEDEDEKEDVIESKVQKLRTKLLENVYDKTKTGSKHSRDNPSDGRCSKDDEGRYDYTPRREREAQNNRNQERDRSPETRQQPL